MDDNTSKKNSKKSLKAKLKATADNIDLKRESTGLKGGLSEDSSMKKSVHASITKKGQEEKDDATSLINKGTGATQQKIESALVGGLENKTGSTDMNAGRVKGAVKDFTVAGGIGSGIGENIKAKKHKSKKTETDSSQKNKTIKTVNNASDTQIEKTKTTESTPLDSPAVTSTPSTTQPEPVPTPTSSPSTLPPTPNSNTIQTPNIPPATGTSLATNASANTTTTNSNTSSALNNSSLDTASALGNTSTANKDPATNNPVTQPTESSKSVQPTQPTEIIPSVQSVQPTESIKPVQPTQSVTSESTTKPILPSNEVSASGTDKSNSTIPAVATGVVGTGIVASTIANLNKQSMNNTIPNQSTNTSIPNSSIHPVANDSSNSNGLNDTTTSTQPLVRTEQESSTKIKQVPEGIERTHETTNRTITEEASTITPEDAAMLGIGTAALTGATSTIATSNIAPNTNNALPSISGQDIAANPLMNQTEVLQAMQAQEQQARNNSTSLNGTGTALGAGILGGNDGASGINQNGQPVGTSTDPHKQYQDLPSCKPNSYLGEDRDKGNLLYESTGYKRRFFVQFLWTKRHFTISKDGIFKYYRNPNWKRRGEFDIAKDFSSFTPVDLKPRNSKPYRINIITDKEDEIAFDTKEKRDEFLYWLEHSIQ
ncbi:hypothetical protein NEOKW01_1415 [Nematocida sp. AWRm80]|nr:hypothetical protein NEOKW01_1415 [Nematocida sp. AWRm80]